MRFYRYLKFKKLIPRDQVVLCFDGLQIMCNDKLLATDLQQNKLLLDCEAEIKSKTGYDLKLKVKFS